MNRRKMKRRNELKKLISVTLLVIFGCALCGGKPKEKEISMSIEGLIDFDKAIFTSNLGVSNPNNAKSDDGNKKEEETAEETKEQTEETVIIVKGKKIYLKGNDKDISADEMLDIVKKKKGNQTVYLKDGDADGYADAVVYKDADNKLSRLCSEMGIDYERD